MKNKIIIASLFLFLSSSTFAASSFKDLLVQFSEMSQQLHAAPASLAAGVEYFSDLRSSSNFVACEDWHFYQVRRTDRNACKSLEKRRADLFTAIDGNDFDEPLKLINLTLKLASSTPPPGVDFSEIINIVQDVLIYFQNAELDLTSFSSISATRIDDKKCAHFIFRAAKFRCNVEATEETARGFADRFTKDESDWTTHMSSLDAL